MCINYTTVLRFCYLEREKKIICIYHPFFFFMFFVILYSFALAIVKYKAMVLGDIV
jgi:hypothetical protein